MLGVFSVCEFYPSGVIEMGCVLSSQLRRYQSHVDELEAMDEAIANRAESLIAKTGDMYPFEINNFWDAFNSCEFADLFNDKTDLTDPTALGK